ncbi:MAG TPA: AAA family ATPase, partial [Novosphingobium sp.]|nr:AAA family ATPase [Novosphingobium sp.]
PRQADPMGTNPVVPGLPADTYVVDTQTRLIGSPQVALRVVRQLHLANLPAYAKGDLTPPAGPLSQTDATPEEARAVVNLLKKVDVRRSGLTYVIDVAVKAPTAELAAQIANGFAQSYIDLGNEAKRNTTANAARYVADNATHLQAQALADDEALHSYMSAHNLMSADGITLAERQISDLSTQMAQAKATLAQEQGKYNAARQQVQHGDGADVNEVLSSETIKQLRTQEAQVSGDLATLQGRYGSRYPDVISARGSLADIHRHIEAERDRILSGLKANVEVARTGLSSLQSSYGQLQTALVANNAALVGMQDLQRKADASKQVYSAFLERAKETAAQAQAPAPDASIAAAARVPALPAWPNPLLAALIGLSAAGLAGLIAIAIAEYLDTSVRSRSEMERQVGIAYAGALPDVRRTSRDAGEHPQDYLINRPFSLFAEALRNLGAFLALRGNGNARVIAITSSLPREGKTTLAVCLGRALARSGRRVILVDGDGRRHSASNLLAGTRAPGKGIEDVLAGSATLPEAIVQDEQSGLFLLPSRGASADAVEITPDMASHLFTALRQDFEWVIVDTAPVLGLAEARVLASAADAVLLVVRWRKTAGRAAQAAVQVLQECRAQLVGGVLSMVDSRQFAATADGDSYLYHGTYKNYYVN